MNMADTKRRNRFVISLGGSILVPGRIDVKFLRGFVSVISSHARKGKKFSIVVGGGKTARSYMNAALDVCRPKRGELDWIGIESTALNALLVRTAFGELAQRQIITDPRKTPSRRPITVLAGWKPGFSSDYDAAVHAKENGIETIINMTDVSYVYTKDPDKHKGAKPIQEITWEGFREIVGGKWIPGMRVPFDPVASEYCEKHGIDVIILNGRKLDNIDSLLSGGSFRGTFIHKEK